MVLKEKKKIVVGLLILVILIFIIVGIMELIEFIFFFILLFLFVVYVLFVVFMVIVMYMVGVVGNMGGGLIEMVILNWILLVLSYGMMYVYQIIIGLCFIVIYFFVFCFFIFKFNIVILGREKEEGQEIKFYLKKEYREWKQVLKEIVVVDEIQWDIVVLYIEVFGGKDNIMEVINCVICFCVIVVDDLKVKSDVDFRELGVYGVVRKGRVFQVIVGLGVL